MFGVGFPTALYRKVKNEPGKKSSGDPLDSSCPEETAGIVRC